MPPISVPRRLPGTLPSSSLGLPTVVEAEQTDQITTPSTESAHWLRDILAARSGATYPTEMSSSPPGTRMHVLWEESGVALWLGMDGRSTEVASRVSVIVQALDRVLRAQGLRLSRVICNGTDVTDSEHGASALFDMPGEKPSRAVSTGY